MAEPDAFAPPATDQVPPATAGVSTLSKRAATARVRASLGVGGFGSQLGLLAAFALLSAAQAGAAQRQGLLAIATALVVGAVCCTVFAWQGLRGARVVATLRQHPSPDAWRALLDADLRFWNAAAVAGVVLVLLPVGLLLWLALIDL